MEPYYRADLALVHHLGFSGHADRCAPDILELLEPVLARRGTVLELGCGSGSLTRHLLAAGHRVVATDASRSMLELARRHAPGAEEVRQLVLPDDPIPPADAIVSVGHVLSYLPDEAAIERSLVAISQALRPGGVLAVDLCDLEWGGLRRDSSTSGRFGDDWAVLTESSVPAPNRLVRRIVVFVRREGTWARDDELHENVLIDTTGVPALLAAHGVAARRQASFGGTGDLPAGLYAIVGAATPAV